MKKRSVLTATAGSLICVVALALTGCSSGGASPAPKGSSATDPSAAKLLPASIEKSGIVSFAMDATYAPFETVDPATGKIVGLDADLAKAIGNELGLKVKLINYGFATIIASLQAGKFDAAASAISITPAREAVVDFVPYLSAGGGLVVAKGNPLNLRMDPLDLCGHKIGAGTGTIQAITQLPAISKQCVAAGKTAVTISLFPNQADVNLAVASGRVDGDMAATISLVQQVKASNGTLALAPGKPYESTPIGIALEKGSPLVPAMKAAVAKLAATGQLATMVTKWGLPASAIVTDK